jgi:hopanoid biosynthesis associated protein HpnK
MSAKSLIVTADDFGLSLAVNEAVEEAHRKGVLTCASLMVTGPAAADAVARAKRMPKLGVGLHLALLDAPSALGRDLIPDLVGPQGDVLASDPVFAGTKIAMLPHVRAQARAEMRAQFELFAKTGLPLDHVDGHWHFHQHPWLLGMLIRDMAPAFGVKAVRVPSEPALPSWRAAGRHGLAKRLATSISQAAICASMRVRLRRAGIASNDWFFGVNDGGHVGRDLLLGFIANLPDGVSEIGLHPATRPATGPFAPPASWRPAEELAALVDPDVIAAARALRLGGFSEIFGGRAA